MDVSGKVAVAIASALNYLENSIETLSSGDCDAFAQNVWHVVAELEYALFLFSIIIQDNVLSKPKATPNPKKIELKQMLDDASCFLRGAEALVKDGKFLAAYENVRNARNCMLNVQEEFSKRRRGESEKQ